MLDIKDSAIAKAWVRFFHMGKTYGVVVKKEKVVK